MGFTIQFFYRLSCYPHINRANERGLRHQLKHCRGILHEMKFLEDEGFMLYKVTVPSYTVLSLIRDVPQVFHIWDSKLSHINEFFYKSKYHTYAQVIHPPSDPELRLVYWACCKTELREHKTY